MASDVDICNIALARLGDEANVASINPPDQSVQAMYCAKFYPLALNSVLDDNDWSFATKTVVLAQNSVNSNSLWPYCYDAPSDMINVISVFDSAAVGDLNYGGSINTSNSFLYGVGSYAQPGLTNKFALHGNQQNYSLEVDVNGNSVIYTDQANAMLKYLSYVSNTQSFSPSFIEALSWRLASLLAGVIIKGDVGVAAGIKCYQTYQIMLAIAITSDAANRNVFPAPIPSGIAARA